MFFGGPWYTFFYGFGICLFSSGLARLIANQGKATREEISQALGRAQAVVLAYSDVLERGVMGHMGGIVSSINELPCSKDEIKMALKLSLKEARHSNNQELIEGIKIAYVSLARFQDIATEDMEALKAHQSTVTGIKAAGDLDAVEVAQSLSASLPVVVKYTDTVNREAAQLKKEIDEG